MLVYCILLVVIGFAFMSHIGPVHTPRTLSEYRKSRRGTFVFVTGLLVCVAGLRYQVGADYTSYFNNYQYYLERSINVFENPEIAVALIARLANIIFDHPQTFVFLCSLLTIGVLMSTLKKYSVLFPLSVFLFVFIGCWIGSFNAVRQYLAATCLVFGLRYIIKGDLIKWMMCVAVGTLCHTTAIIMFPIYFVVRMKRSVKLYCLLAGIFAVLFVSYDYLFGFMDAVNGNTGRSVADRLYAQNSISLFRVIVAWMPVVFQFFPRQIQSDSMEERVILNYSLLNAVLLTAAMNSAYLGRIKIYFDFHNALAIPLIVSKYDRRNQRTFSLVILVLYFGYWLFEATGAYVVNYQWIFGK